MIYIVSFIYIKIKGMDFSSTPNIIEPIKNSISFIEILFLFIVINQIL